MIDNIKISDLNALGAFWGMPTSKITTLSLARSLNVSEKTVIAILENTGYENSTLYCFLNEGQVEQVIRKLAKELKKQYSRQKKNYNILSFYEKQDFDELDSLFHSCKKRLSSENDIYSLFRSTDKNAFAEYTENISNFTKEFSDWNKLACIVPFPENGYQFSQEVEIEQIEAYLYKLVYADISYLGEWSRVEVRSEDESDVPFILFKYLSRIKVKSRKYSCIISSQFARFYVCGHYYNYNNDDEDHSTRKIQKEAS